MAELQQYKGGYYLWRYVPSLAAAALFALLFFRYNSRPLLAPVQDSYVVLSALRYRRFL